MNEYGLMTDRYELTMLDSFVKDGTVSRKAVFEVFARKLQPGFRYGVFAGLGRLLPMIEAFEFSGENLKWIREEGLVSKETYDYLAEYSFKGTITSYREGDLYFPNSPLVTIEGTLGECVVLETLVLSVLNHDSAIATKAARMVMAARGRGIIEMGSRRTHEESAVAAARAAYLTGFTSTSNLLAGKRYGIPTVGTAAHAFTLAHDSEMDAFTSQVKTHGAGTTLLVDTYDTHTGIEHACMAVNRVTGEKGPGAIRLDSGDLGEEAHAARVLLDSLGAHATKITVTSDVDEYVMNDLAEAPIDGFGVGTQLVSTPPAGMVYKLVSIEQNDGTMRPVAKKAHGKASVGGKKQAFRVFDVNGFVIDEVFTTDGSDFHVESNETIENLQSIVVVNGVTVGHGLADLEEVREYHASRISDLPPSESKVWSTTPSEKPYLMTLEV